MKKLEMGIWAILMQQLSLNSNYEFIIIISNILFIIFITLFTIYGMKK